MQKPWKDSSRDYRNKDLEEYVLLRRHWFEYYELLGKHVNRNIEHLRGNSVVRIELEYKYNKIKRELVNTAFGLKKNIIRRRLNRRKSPISVYLWRSGTENMKNFGDEVTADIISDIFGYRYSIEDVNNCSLVGAGSILEVVKERSGDNRINVWGSGLMREGLTAELPNVSISAVRGPLTRDRLDSKCAIGDPGILANVIYRASDYKLDKIGFVVHYIDMDLPIVRKINEDDRFMIINPLDPPAVVAENISSCKAILSSSLHGLIFADSFGVANSHVELSDRVVGSGYKFRDYYAGISRHYLATDVNDVFKTDILESILENYTPIADLRNLQKKLIEAFPEY